MRSERGFRRFCKLLVIGKEGDRTSLLRYDLLSVVDVEALLRSFGQKGPPLNPAVGSANRTITYVLGRAVIDRGSPPIAA